MLSVSFLRGVDGTIKRMNEISERIENGAEMVTDFAVFPGCSLFHVCFLLLRGYGYHPLFSYFSLCSVRLILDPSLYALSFWIPFPPSLPIPRPSPSPRFVSPRLFLFLSPLRHEDRKHNDLICTLE